MSLLNDIKLQSDWLVEVMAVDGFKLDHSIRSFIEIDRFFHLHCKDGKPVPGGRLSVNMGNVLFSIGAYIGETIIRAAPGSIWETDDDDPMGEVTATLVLPDGTRIWPMQRVINRFNDGPEDAIYLYGHYFIKNYSDEPFDQSFWEIPGLNKAMTARKKPWWKFW